MARVGLFGGSFNPIHKGHLHLARQLFRLAQLDELWFMVSPQNPLKQQDELLDDGIRLRLVEIALARYSRFKACDYEFHLPRPSYTWNTLEHLRADFPEHQFTLIIGGDNWLRFNNWYRHDDILHNYQLAVYPREGCPVDVATLPANVLLAACDLVNVSSSQIRQLIRERKPYAHLVPKAVAKVIEKEQLYR